MSNKMWEVDPQKSQKLQEIQKKNKNNTCVDCGAPGPQWASPKFGIFMCLSCSGLHRNLGVHISFIRSITMDAFKNAEVARMEAGGNEPWKTFWDNHENIQLEGMKWDDSTIRERYDSDVGEEWKARLTAKVEGREYVPGEEKKNAPVKKVESVSSQSGSRSATPVGGRGPKGPAQSAIKSSAGAARSSSPALGTMSMSKKSQNEAYFARMGAENESRSEDLAPSQGGKYTGFGSDPWPQQQNNNSSMPGADEFQKDPLAALTKGFGWFGGMVQKGVGDVSQRIAAADLQSQARALGTTVSSTLQNGGRAATDTFTRFVEGDQHVVNRTGQPNTSRSGPAPERQDFWDDFAAAGEARMAEKKPAGPDADKLDFWDDFAEAGEAKMANKKHVEPERKDFWDDFSNIGGSKPVAQQNAAKSKSSIGTAAMRRPNAGDKKDDEWNEW